MCALMLFSRTISLPRRHRNYLLIAHNRELKEHFPSLYSAKVKESNGYVTKAKASPLQIYRNQLTASFAIFF